MKTTTLKDKIFGKIWICSMGQILLSLVLMMSSTALYAAGGAEGSGPGSGGGGHQIESGFKTKVLLIIKQAQDMLPEQKAKLKFNPYALSARIAVPNSFKPLCAKESDLITLTKLNKMAYVTDHRTGIVHLDCTNYSLAEWQILFNSQKLEEKPFFLHEALRVLNIENEDDYNISSSIVAATMADPNYENKMVANMMANLLSKQNPMCSIQINKDSVVFYVKDQIADGAKAFTTSWLGIEDVRAVLIDSTGSANVNDPFDAKALIGFKNRVFVRAVEVGCY